MMPNFWVSIKFVKKGGVINGRKTTLKLDDSRARG